MDWITAFSNTVWKGILYIMTFYLSCSNKDDQYLNKYRIKQSLLCHNRLTLGYIRDVLTLIRPQLVAMTWRGHESRLTGEGFRIIGPLWFPMSSREWDQMAQRTLEQPAWTSHIHYSVYKMLVELMYHLDLLLKRTYIGSQYIFVIQLVHSAGIVWLKQPYGKCNNNIGNTTNEPNLRSITRSINVHTQVVSRTKRQ